jgi:hypothetical protein
LPLSNDPDHEIIKNNDSDARQARDRDLATSIEQDKQVKLSALKKMLQSYPDGSLERLAIEEEIKKTWLNL